MSLLTNSKIEKEILRIKAVRDEAKQIGFDQLQLSEKEINKIRGLKPSKIYRGGRLNMTKAK